MASTRSRNKVVVALSLTLASGFAFSPLGCEGSGGYGGVTPEGSEIAGIFLER